MNYHFELCTPGDIKRITELDEAAIAFQKTVSHLHWKPFDNEAINREIVAGRYWKIVESGEIAFLFVVAFHDPGIWGDEETGKAIYLHRFVTNPAFRGRGYVKALVTWALDYARKNGLDFVRLDTWLENTALCDYYRAVGFRNVRERQLTPHPELPPHYWNMWVQLFEMEVDV